MGYNQDAWRMVKDKVADAATAAQTAATGAAATALAAIYAGAADDLPTGKTAVIGQLFIKTGATNPGLYVCTASTSSASTWKAVSHAS